MLMTLLWQQGPAVSFTSLKLLAAGTAGLDLNKVLCILGIFMVPKESAETHSWAAGRGSLVLTPRAVVWAAALRPL